MNQPYTYRYPLPFGPPSHLGYHSALGELPLLHSMFPSVVHFTRSINNVHVSTPVSQFLPPHPFPPWHPYICSLRLCLYFCFATKIISTIFLDSTVSPLYPITSPLHILSFIRIHFKKEFTDIQAPQGTLFPAFMCCVLKVVSRLAADPFWG